MKETVGSKIIRQPNKYKIRVLFSAFRDAIRVDTFPVYQSNNCLLFADSCHVR